MIMTTASSLYRIDRRAGQQGSRPSVDRQAEVEKYVTGCDNSSLSSNYIMLPETTSSDRRFPTETSVRFENINISTLNIRTLSCDIKLANSI